MEIVSILDIVLIIGALISIIIGCKKGFMKKFLSFFGILIILVFSIMFAGQVSLMLTTSNAFGIHDSIYKGFYSNLSANMASYPDGATVKDIIEQGLNLKFLSGIISNMIGVPSDTSVSEIIVFIANGLTGICMNVIAFGMIFVGSLIVLLILNILVNILRNVNFIKVIDGILGAVLSLVIYLAIVAGLFALLRVFMGQDWFTIKDWFITDMHLTDDAFRISKALYQNNIFINIISIFGPIK